MFHTRTHIHTHARMELKVTFLISCTPINFLRGDQFKGTLKSGLPFTSRLQRFTYKSNLANNLWNSMRGYQSEPCGWIEGHDMPMIGLFYARNGETKKSIQKTQSMNQTTKARLRSRLFSDLLTCSSLGKYQRFGDTCRIHISPEKQGILFYPKMEYSLFNHPEAGDNSFIQTARIIYKTTQRHIPGDTNIHIYCGEKLKSR